MFELNISLLYTLFGALMLIFLDVILGIAISLKEGTFQLKEFPKFLRTQVLPYYIGLISLTGFAMIDNDILQLGTVPVAYASIIGYGVKMVWTDIIKEKIPRLFGISIEENQK